jgi:hypothetical protein
MRLKNEKSPGTAFSEQAVHEIIILEAGASRNY